MSLILEQQYSVPLALLTGFLLFDFLLIGSSNWLPINWHLACFLSSVVLCNAIDANTHTHWHTSLNTFVGWIPRSEMVESERAFIFNLFAKLSSKRYCLINNAWFPCFPERYEQCVTKFLGVFWSAGKKWYLMSVIMCELEHFFLCINHLYFSVNCLFVLCSFVCYIVGSLTDF